MGDKEQRRIDVGQEGQGVAATGEGDSTLPQWLADAYQGRVNTDIQGVGQGEGKDNE